MDDRNQGQFPEQSEPVKLHGDKNANDRKEKYIRDGGKIEDYPEEVPARSGSKEDSAHLTDVSGEEKKEDYINTDERKKDLEKHSG